jgi:hydrogenase expression/formation protein HypC
MCLAVPVKIIALNGSEATIEIQGVERSVNVALIPDPAIGDFVLVHAGFAIQKWSLEDVEEYQKIVEQMDALAGDE